MRAGALLRVPRAFGYWTGMSGREQRHNGCARILTYHGTPAARAGEFERQLRYLKRHFDIVPLAVLVQAVEAGEGALDARLALTFDDGLRSNIEVIYPLAKELGIPVTFFVCPGLIERGAWLWNMEARQRLRWLGPERATTFTHVLHSECGAPAEGASLVEWMKGLPLESRMEVEERIRSATKAFSPPERSREECDLAGWDELRALEPTIVSIGSHTLTHPILPLCGTADLEREIVQSRRLLEGKLERAVELFAYPNGDQDERVLACVRRHYRAAVSTVQNWIRAGCDAHLLPRVDAPQGALRLCWNMHNPDYVPCVS